MPKLKQPKTRAKKSSPAPRAPRRTAVKRDKSREECPHCVDGAESFRYFGGAYKFDVDLAREIVQDGRDRVELTPDDVKYSVDMSRIYPQHLEHVDTKYPGIIAHVWGPGKGGRWLHGHLLIDGHHRAARCLQLGLPYFVYLLSEAESETVLIRGPGAKRPQAPKAGKRSTQKKAVAAKRTPQARRRTGGR